MISSTEMKELMSLPKEVGFERFRIIQFADVIQSAVKDIATNDSQLTVFRFKNNVNKSQDYRLICKQDNIQEKIFYIIGFDFDHTAYKH